MYALAQHIPLIIYWYHEPVYVTYFGLDVNFLNGIQL